MDKEKNYHSLYFIGIKGVGMSALAIVAKELGYDVTGSDVAEQFITDASLQGADIRYHENFDANHIDRTIDLIVIGAAFGEDNPEVKRAKELNLQRLTYAELLGYLSKDKKTIAIAGTHGKTTTTSITSFLLFHAGFDPSYVIGTGHITGLPSHGHGGKGEYFVIEADDYKRSPTDSTPKFLDLSPTLALITSIEHDHPDLYPTLAECVEAFVKFIDRVKPDGTVLVNGDDPQIQKLISRFPEKPWLCYGFGKKVDWQIIPSENGFSLQKGQLTYGPYRLTLRGKHNIANAAAATIIVKQLGMKEEDVTRLLPTFAEVERRYQLLGKRGEIVIIDDYAHHPTAVKVTLETAKEQFPNRPLWCLFQPHTYSRTAALLHEFAESFSQADHVIITDIFGSAREQAGTVNAEDLVQAIKPYREAVVYIPYSELVTYLTDHLQPNAVLLTMGAGDIYKIGKALITGKEEATEVSSKISGNPFYEKLVADIPALVADELLAKHSTIRVGGPAKAFVTIKSVDELAQAVKSARQTNIPYHILGGGSNTLFSDKGFDGLVTKNMASGMTIGGQTEQLEELEQSEPVGEVRHEAADPQKYVSFLDLNYEERPGDTLVMVESGANLTALIVRTLDAGLTGLQWFGGIPGVIGGAVYNNIHGGTHFIAERISSVEVLTAEAEIKKFDKDELAFDYDMSRFHGTRDVILRIELLLTKGTQPEVERAEYTFREWTKRKSQMQPKLGSMGSTFQNIPQEFRERIGAPTTGAGWLIDQCGLKGKQIGQAQIAKEHANFIVNLGGATASDVYQLIQLAKKEVKRKFGVDLQTEVFLIGDFSE